VLVKLMKVAHESVAVAGHVKLCLVWLLSSHLTLQPTLPLQITLQFAPCSRAHTYARMGTCHAHTHTHARTHTPQSHNLCATPICASAPIADRRQPSHGCGIPRSEWLTGIMGRLQECMVC